MNLFEQLRGKKILLVDDDYFIRDSVCLFFRSEDCTPLAMSSAEEAIELLRGEEFDIILCSFILPGKNGLEFFKTVNEFNPSAIKVLLLSHTNEQVLTEGAQMGIHDFILKPFVTKTIEDSLIRIIQNRDHPEIPDG